MERFLARTLHHVICQTPRKIVSHPTARTNPRAIQMALDRMQSTLCGRIRAMLARTDAGFIGEFPSLVAEVEAGFRQEEALMELRNDARVHARREDNATILCALHRVAPQVELGNVCLGRQVAAALHDVISVHRLSIGLKQSARPSSGGALPSLRPGIRTLMRDTGRHSRRWSPR
jgi:hypothetical protein